MSATNRRVSDKGRQIELNLGKDKLQVTIGDGNLSKVWLSLGALVI